MRKIFNVGILGATGMVGQRFVSLLQDHPWFKVKVLAASKNSSNCTYYDTIKDRWKLDIKIPDYCKNMNVFDLNGDFKHIIGRVDFVFCAIGGMSKEEIKDLEEKYAKAECPVISNNSANRNVSDVPMVIPEINPEHIQVIEHQRNRLNTHRGFIAVKSNCSIQSYVPAISALMKYSPSKILACTYQAISGAGETLSSCEEINDNIIPYINGEEKKSELEPLKIFGEVHNGRIIPNKKISITTQCLRVPVSDGHTAAVFVQFDGKPTIFDIKNSWLEFNKKLSRYVLPSSPYKFITYFEQDDRPQPKLDRNLENGMGIGVGRLRTDSQYDYKFVCFSHNTIRGAAGGAILMAELLVREGYI